MSVQLRCCGNIPILEIEYEIGTVYLVCDECSKQKHFARSIKSKKKINLDVVKTKSNPIEVINEIVEMPC